MTDEPRGTGGRGQRKPGDSRGRPATSASGAGGRRGGDRRGGERRGGERRGGERRDQRRDQGRPPRDRAERTAEQARYDGPELPEEITGQELDRNVLAQLRGLPDKLAARVARHLVAAGQLMDTDPETAYQHTLAARARAARVAVVREATGEAAYAAGHFAEALSEFRAAKRMNGAIDYLPVMADCERALGRPERSLELAKSPSVEKLPDDQRIEMTIVEAGARYDLGEVDGALRTLENAPLKSIAREDWVVRLRYAYADLLLKAGRRDDAIEWFHRTAGIDSRQITDAAERIEELEGTGSSPEE
ncbi:tetratricopeptide repeat protein [Nocardioides caldifontis]|uniref:tetratricopeptide repeat protein n=1 Tax=Nocardioides caldifontis TaxID=2588938 RepID=UPI0011DFC337|nr:tetratricopeptide repeat protein [Nocardioides caldifontis]